VSEFKEGMMNRGAMHQRSFLTLVLAALLFTGGMAGCTVKNFNPQISTFPTQRYAVLAIGDIGIYDLHYDYLLAFFRRGFVDTIQPKQVFETVEDPAPAPLPGSSLLLTGRITEVDEGNEALRWLIGMGAGKAIVKGTFVLSDASGKTLSKFEAQESYSEGAGVGGIGVVGIEGLMKAFGGTIALRTLQWSKGETMQ
jgi:hypothetical protein